MYCKNTEESFIKSFDSTWIKNLIIIQDEISFITYNFYRNKGYRTLHLPYTTGAISSPMGIGSDSIPVKATINCKDTYLADSMQFYLEYACRVGNSKGYFYLMPSVRGENADKRHLNQFYHSEVEIIGKLEDAMNLAEEYITYLNINIYNNVGNLIYKLSNGNSPLKKFVESKQKFKRISYQNACKILDFDRTYFNAIDDDYIINSLGEKKILEMNEGYVWITNYPSKLVPFYQAKKSDDSRLAMNADMLFGIGEVIGSGQRSYSEIDLIENLVEHNVDQDQYEWYLLMKKIKKIQTAGFGMGVERYIMWLLNIEDIRACQIIPRYWDQNEFF